MQTPAPTPTPLTMPKPETRPEPSPHLAAPAGLLHLIRPGDTATVSSEEQGTTQTGTILAVHAFGVTVDEDADGETDSFVSWERVELPALLIAERTYPTDPAGGRRN